METPYFDRTEWDITYPDKDTTKDTWTYVIYHPDGTFTTTNIKPE
jgi:hypothetical protein